MSNNLLMDKYYHHTQVYQALLSAKKNELLNDGYVIDMLDIDQDLPSTPTKSGFVDESF